MTFSSFTKGIWNTIQFGYTYCPSNGAIASCHRNVVACKAYSKPQNGFERLSWLDGQCQINNFACGFPSMVHQTCSFLGNQKTSNWERLRVSCIRKHLLYGRGFNSRKWWIADGYRAELGKNSDVHPHWSKVVAFTMIVGVHPGTFIGITTMTNHHYQPLLGIIQHGSGGLSSPWNQAMATMASPREGPPFQPEFTHAP